MEKVRYTISDAAQMMDVESHALRYWEEELDLSVPRNEQGHRYYTKENIEQFQKIKDLKEKGYQLKAIKMLLHEEQPLLETEPQPKEKAKAKEKPQVPAATAQPQMAQVTQITKQRVQSSKTGADEKMEQFQNLMTGIVKRAIEENNQALGLAVGEQVGCLLYTSPRPRDCS